MPRTYEPIASVTIANGASSVEFTSIPGTYTDLRIVLSNYNASSGGGIVLRYNGDTGSNYSETYLEGNGSSAASGRGSNRVYSVVGFMGSTSGSHTTLIDIQSYANTSVNKTALSSHISTANAVIRYVSMWRSTSAITSVSVICDGRTFTGGTCSLYGITAA